MLLTLDPIDSDASLLLGKVLAARGQWQEALQRLDAAQANGARVPSDLRERVENALRNQIQDAEEQRLRLAARERTEIRNLRAEAKRLRSDNAVLDSQVQSLYKRVRLWSSATALVSGCAAALLLVAIVSGGGNAAPEVATTLPTAVDTPAPTPTATTATATNGLEPTVEMPINPIEPTAELPTIEVTEATPVETVPSVALPTSHTVVSGDTLGSIALNYYGKSSKWRNIRDANSTVLKGSIKLSLGMELTVPVLAE